MYYHARIAYGGISHYWWNKSRDTLCADLVLPFVNGHVVLIKKQIQQRGNSKVLLNLKSANTLSLYRTDSRLERGTDGGIPVEFRSGAIYSTDCTAEVIDELRSSQAPVGSRSLLQHALATPKNQVFVVMKFGEPRLDSAYEGVIRPLIEEFSLKPLRIDEVQNSGPITDQVLEEISSSKYVLADLTGERPNCYYECGFAHAIGRELILTIAANEPVHFDLAAYRFIQWSTEAELRRKLRSRLETLHKRD
jgi:hypothetical protein